MEALYDNLFLWLSEHGFRILLILVIAYSIDKSVDKFAERTINTYVERTQKGRDKEEIDQRAETLNDVFSTTTSVIVIGIALMMILPELGVNIGSLLAGAGVIGLAIGFGAQNLVRDMLAGLFIILEDQYGKGDVVKIAGVSGVVDEVNLRRTILRDLDGVEHHIPNGEIKVASNKTKDWSRINLLVPVSYEEDIDHVVKLLERVAKEFKKAHSRDVTEVPQILGMDNFGESDVKIRIIAKTKPGKQWELTRDLRKRIRERFMKEGIAVPFPRRVIINKK